LVLLGSYFYRLIINAALKFLIDGQHIVRVLNRGLDLFTVGTEISKKNQSCKKL
jgi:hypothetical protein